MAKGKSQYCTWFCPECKKANDISAYDKRRNDEIVKEISKFCPKCRKHTDHKRKDTKKGKN
ncbi:50S ribosomal protein L33 [Candidatus Peregrinibacteria bacterium CG_4_10_14_0_2_um_filter_38_24]|nr:MAG: 50S ribosomal protein L33 [Candidatus Peregrinibacteria bacterium CG_4_10_14_0_2_um_filter_38_24]PJC39186.1 MAG: 50S ribosomal protein L33 [Candidatus Peregrinibacteria bacterium CG_4_9_14_0_2_um_filter_38_9]